MVDLSQLERTAAELAAVVEQRSLLIGERDRLIADALEAGATWAAVQAASGMGPRGVQLAVRRASRS